MRLLLSCTIIAGLFAGQASAVECARQAERPAFDVAGLKSELMVTAIACKANSKYNAFIGRYQGDLTGEDKALNGYFSRNFGRQGQKQHDEYITSLANVQSQQSMKSGTLFCDERVPMFDEVMALQSPQDLPAYAAGKDLAAPAALTMCANDSGEKTTLRRGGRRSGGRSKKH